MKAIKEIIELEAYHIKRFAKIIERENLSDNKKLFIKKFPNNNIILIWE